MRFFRAQVLQAFPHPARGLTQGLLAERGTVWESGGQYGLSVLRRYELGAAVPEAEESLPPDLYAEGICRVGTSIWQLTWRERVALRWDAASLTVTDRVPFNREGWGICAVPAYPQAVDNVPVENPGTIPDPSAAAVAEVVTSDGTSELVRRDPRTLEPRAVVHVRCGGRRVRWLNDLAWAGGLVWANVLGTSCLAGIDLDSGELAVAVDARAAGERHANPQMVLNGIAPLAQPGEFLLTGKGWRSVRHVRLEPDRDRGQVERLLAGATALTRRT